MLRRYILLPVIIGIGVGLSAILFVYALEIITEYVLEGIVGYVQPLPAGEGGPPVTRPYP